MAHLVWDWNGTLLDDLALTVEATNASLAALGAAPVTTEQHRERFCRPLSDYYSQLLGWEVTADEFAIIDDVFHLTYQSGLASCQLTEDAIDAMDAWSAGSGTQSLLSMWTHAQLTAELDRRGIADRLLRADGRVDPAGSGDPASDTKAGHLIRHLAGLGLPGRACVLIGDSVDDAAAAAGTGADCVLYAGGITDVRVLAATGYPVAATLTEAVTIAGRRAQRAPADAGCRPEVGPAS